jgi:hypothetical protein
MKNLILINQEVWEMKKILKTDGHHGFTLNCLVHRLQTTHKVNLKKEPRNARKLIASIQFQRDNL